MKKKVLTAKRLPLYQHPRIRNLKTDFYMPRKAHAGLWYDKFCHQWREYQWELASKLDWIKTITEFKGKIGNKELITESTERFQKLVQQMPGHQLWLAKTVTRFVTGIGQSHPINNGFTWHPTLGTPYLPSSSLKGLVRHWVREQNQLDQEEEEQIFGSEAKSTTTQVGQVIFFDALPQQPVRCEIDILTPHHPSYYKNPEKAPPGDWENPLPIPFLTVAPEQTFLFALAPRTNSQEAQIATKKAFQWLQEALQQAGAGAKTDVGYGQF
jgi:CRISPR-associated protein Cmr6